LAGIVDSQSVKASGAPECGYDAYKKLSIRKLYIAVDTDGRLLAVSLTPADLAYSTDAQLALDALVKRWPWAKHLYAAYEPAHLAGQGSLIRLSL